MLIYYGPLWLTIAEILNALRLKKPKRAVFLDTQQDLSWIILEDSFIRAAVQPEMTKTD